MVPIRLFHYLGILEASPDAATKGTDSRPTQAPLIFIELHKSQFPDHAAFLENQMYVPLNYKNYMHD